MDKIELDEPLVDMLTAFFSHWWNAPGQNTREGAKDWIGSNEGKAAIRAYLAATTSEPVAVKALEWQEQELFRYKGYWKRRWSVAEKLVGDYRIDVTWKDGDEEPSQPLYYLWAMGGPKFPTLEEAQAAAQADYERRIRSALTTPPAAPTAIDVAIEAPIATAQRGFDAWASKPHNAKWFRRIDGTPIPNDLVVCIAEAFASLKAKRETA